ncbi:MAG: sialidase family protein [Actinomycetota bacterium]
MKRIAVPRNWAHRLVIAAVAVTFLALVLVRTAAQQHTRASLQTGPVRAAGPTVSVIERAPDRSGQKGSGGPAVVHYAGAKEIKTGRLVKQAPDARLYHTGFASFEPTMGITDDGSIFINGFVDPNLLATAIIRSVDGGKTWEVVFDGHPTTNDPYMYVDPTTSRIFANDFLLPGCQLISISDDAGDTWMTLPPAACLYNFDHQTIFAGPAPPGGVPPVGYPNVLYLCSIAGGASVASVTSACSKSLDGGISWVPTGTPAFFDDPRAGEEAGVPGLCNGANGHGFVGPDGTVYLPRGWCGQPWLAISTDEGLTWTRVQVADNYMACCGLLAEIEGTAERIELYSHEAGVVADEEGSVYYTWVAGDRLPYLVISRDGGATWGKPMMIGPPGVNETLLPSIAIGATGKIAIHYMGTENSPWNGREATGSYEDTQWNGYITMTTNALAKRPVFYTASINDPKEPLWIGPCGPDPDRCGWGDFFDVVIAEDGTPWSVAIDMCSEIRCIGAEASGEGVVAHLVGGPKLK